MNEPKPAGASPVDLELGLLPEREGQPRIYTATGPVPEAGHWYSPAAVRELLAAERERIAAWLDQDWTADAAEEREHRKFIAAKLRQHEA